MDNCERQVLMTGDRIILRKINIATGKVIEQDKTEFSVISVIGEGGSAVCYEASCESDGTSGRLKEFYPAEFLSVSGICELKRDSNNQLLFLGEGEEYKKNIEEFKKAYFELAKARNKKSGAVLNNYIPAFEVYEGIAPSNEGVRTIYIWSRHDKLVKTFGSYLKDVREDMKVAAWPEHHLFNILNALLTVTKCIRAMHSADFIHSDINPDNFGVMLDENDNVESGGISMYDVNTIYSADGDAVRTMGTEGFRAPEVIKGEVSSRSDIYSIGATLFTAVVFNDETEILYKDEYYFDLERMVAKSKLILSSDRNSNSALRDKIVEILKKTLAHNPQKRYESCGLLLEDLDEARKFLFPKAFRETLTECGQEIKRENIEEHLDKKAGDIDATGVIQRLLFEYPLYGESGNSKKIRDILVVGAGTYAEKFIDIAFEVSQIENCYLRITAVSNNSLADKTRYLSSRPAFAKFFTVDGVAPQTGVSYGSLYFASTETKGGLQEFEKNKPEENREIIESVLFSDRDRKYSYVFIALGDDELNYDIAKVCKLSEDYFSYPCQIHFAWDGESRDFGDLDAVYINSEIISESDYYKDLRRMAFNCHILWNDSLNIDINKLKGEFRIPYNFNSSFSNVLSIKYKLHSMKIDSIEDSSEAARQVVEAYREGGEKLIEKLVLYEHRRWMVNYICQGWDTMTDFSGLTSDTKDKKEKLHPCLVPASGSCVLSSQWWQKNNCEKWDKATEGEIAKLDELDRVSIMLHRHFKAKAEEIKSSASIQKYVDDIANNLFFYDAASKAFEKFVMCLNEIMEGKTKRTKLYSYYKKCLDTQIKELPAGVMEVIRGKVALIEKIFAPILQSQKHIDYKANDKCLVEGIPFILTYSTGIRLCIPFGIEPKGDFNNRILFGNVAAALVLNPSVVTYIVDVDEVSVDTDRFIKSLKYAINCMDGRNMQAAVNIMFLQSAHNQVVETYFKKVIRDISPRIRNIDIIEYENDNQLRDSLLDYLREHQKNKKKCFSAMERNSTGISKLMRGMGCYLEVPEYSYDSVKGEFITNPGCEFLKYVKNDDYLRVSDMFDFKDAKNNSELPEMQKDYKFFWKLYKSSRLGDKNERKEQVWKKLCEVLEEHAEKNDTILEMWIPNVRSGSAELKKRDYFIPLGCREAVGKILRELKEISTAFTGDNPSVTYHNSTTCKVTFVATPELFDKFEELISNPYYLYDASKISVIKKNKKVLILFDSLVVDKLEKSALTSAFTDADLKDRLNDLLKEIDRHNYIVNFKEYDEGTKKYIRFTYASSFVKQLMTKAGRILELYIYYKALEQDYFDDVAMGCEIVWNKDNVSNEFDIILTKGYRALIVEAKATVEISQNYYYKIAQLCQRFGINAIPVLVADTVEFDNRDNSINEMQRVRGAELGVKTVYKFLDIKGDETGGGVGEALRKIMEAHR